MIALGINEFIRNIKKNILIIIQMIAIYMISIFVVSAFVEQYSLYKGVANILDDTGILIQSNNKADKEGKYATAQMYEKLLTKVEGVATTYHHNVFSEEYTFKNHTDVLDMQIVSSDLNYLTYKPKLLEGEWCEDADKRDGCINIVISDNNNFDIKIGDVIDIDGLSFNVVGKYDSQELVYSYNNKFAYEDTNYLHFYDSVDNEEGITGKGCCMALASFSDMEKYCNPMKIPQGKVIIDYEDDITKEEYDENINILKETYGYIELEDIIDARVVFENSKEHLEIKLLPMFVLLVVILFVLIISMNTASAVNVLYEKINYGIYFICGNNWKNTFIISGFHWLCVSVISFIAAVCGCMLMKASGKFEQLTLSFSLYHICVICGITIIALLAALILPYNMLRKIQPVSILKENED